MQPGAPSLQLQSPSSCSACSVLPHPLNNYTKSNYHQAGNDYQFNTHLQGRETETRNSTHHSKGGLLLPLPHPFEAARSHPLREERNQVWDFSKCFASLSSFYPFHLLETANAMFQTKGQLKQRLLPLIMQTFFFFIFRSNFPRQAKKKRTNV